MTPAALLLDLDGTLVDTEPLNRAAYRAFFKARGWEEPDLYLFTGRRAEDVFATEPGPWVGLDPVKLAREVITKIDRDAVPVPLPGAADLLAAAVQLKIQVAIVTSAGPAWVRRAAGALPGLDEVDLVVTTLDVVNGKPDPAGFALACQRLSVTAGDAMAVEDSPAGVRAAVSAGVGQVVGVTTTHETAKLTAAGADPVVADLLGVVTLIGG